LRSRQIPTPAVQPALDTETATRLRAAIGRLSRRLRTTAAGRAAGLTPTGSSLLLNVDRNGPVRLSALAASEGINPTMLSRIVAGMVEQGLLERTSDEGDRRAAWVNATRTGRLVAQRMRRERTDAVNAAMVALGEREQRLIERALPALEALAEELKERRP
jgi:DNA-binding MarR family transcriptional regulator